MTEALNQKQESCFLCRIQKLYQLKGRNLERIVEADQLLSIIRAERCRKDGIDPPQAEYHRALFYFLAWQALILDENEGALA